MLQAGQVVYSAAGHDKDSFYVVVQVDQDGACRIADGKRRRLDSPKRKNPRHLLATHSVIDLTQIGSDKALRRALAALQKKPAEE